MPPILIYLLQVNALLVLFFLAYSGMLRKLTFFTLNRIFLFIGILCSLFLPVIECSLFDQHQPVLNSTIVRVLEVADIAVKRPEPVWSWEGWGILIFIYWVGFGGMFFRLVLQMLSLYFIHKKSRPITYNNFQYREVKEEINPFSFWQTIYLNPARHSKEELSAILQHEQIHVKEWHTGDLLLAELKMLVCWFNPVAWLMKVAIKDNLEFVVDERMLKHGFDYKPYQYLLIKISSPKRALTNNFTTCSLKKRIRMMNKSRSSRKQALAYLTFLPVLWLFIVLSESYAEAALTVDTVKWRENSNIQKESGVDLVASENNIFSAAIDTLPGTAAIIKNLWLQSQPREMIVFLKNSQGRGIDIYVKMEGDRILQMKIMAIAPAGYKGK